MSPLISAGEWIRLIAAWLQLIAHYAANIALALAILLLLIRFLVDHFDSNPFGRFAYYARRPTNKWFYEIKGSQFYRPVKQALGFEPIWVLLLLAFVLFFFLLRSLVDDVTLLLNCVGITLTRFGTGDTLSGVQGLIGTILLGLIYFLMGLMTILVINSWFGLFDRAAYWAGRRIYPLLRSFDSSGRLGPLIFLLLFFLLSLFAGAVLRAFF
jgi:hypothetical protein